MKKIKSTNTWILLYSIIVSSVATEHATSHHNGPRHGATSSNRKKFQNEGEPMEIQMPEQVMSTPSVSCISPDLNIFEIMNESKRTCKGKDMTCTFYLFANSKYYNIGSAVIDKELFNKLLGKYDNLLVTTKTIAPENVEFYFDNHDRLNEYDHLYQSDISPVFTEDQDFMDINSYNSKYAENIDDLDFYKEHKSRTKSHRNKHKHIDNSIRFIDVEEKPRKHGKYAELVPEYNKDGKYFEVFLPKDKHKGKSRTKVKSGHDELFENQRIHHRYDTSSPYEENPKQKSHHHRKTTKSKDRTNIFADDVEGLFKATEARDEGPHITSILSSNTDLEDPQELNDYGDKIDINMQDERLNISDVNTVEIFPENDKQILSNNPNIDNSDEGVNSTDDLGNLISENTTLNEISPQTINIEPVIVNSVALDPTTNNILAEIPDRTQNNDNVSASDDITIDIDPNDQLSAYVLSSKSNKSENISTADKIVNVTEDITHLVNNDYRHIHELIDQGTINDIHDNKTVEYTNIYNEHNFDETHDLSVHNDILKTSHVHWNEPVFRVIDSIEENQHNKSVYICTIPDFDTSDSNAKFSDYTSQNNIKPSRNHDLDSTDICVKPIITKPLLHATPILETDLPNTLIPDINLYSGSPSTWPNLVRPSINSLLHSDLSSTHLIEDVCESDTVINPYIEGDLFKNELKVARPCIEKGIYEEVIPEYFSPTEIESPILNNLITVESPCITPKDTTPHVHLDLLRTPLSSEFDENFKPIPQAFPTESTRTTPMDLGLIPCTSKMALDAPIYYKQEVSPASSTGFPHLHSVQPYIEPTMSDQFQFLTTKNLNHESPSHKIYLDQYPSENAEFIPCQVLRSDDLRPMIGPDQTSLVNQVPPHQTPAPSNILSDTDIQNYLSTEQLNEITKNKLQPDQILELSSKDISLLNAKPPLHDIWQNIPLKNNQIMYPYSPLLPSASLPSFQPGLFQSGILPSLNRVPYSQIPFIPTTIVKPFIDTDLFNNKPLKLDNDNILTTINNFAQSTQNNPLRDEELFIIMKKLPSDLKRLLQLEPYLTDLTDSNKPKEISKSLQYINTPSMNQYTNIEDQNLQPESFINPEYENVLPSTLSVLQPQKANSQQAIIVPTANEFFTELDKDSLFRPLLPTEYSQISPSVTDSSIHLNTLSPLLLNTNNEIKSTNLYLDKPLQVSPAFSSKNELKIMSPKTQTTSLFATPIDYASQPKQFDISQNGKSIVSISPDSVIPQFYEETESVVENFVETNLDNLLSNSKTNFYEEIQPALENFTFETLAPNVAGTTAHDMSMFKPISSSILSLSPSEASTVSMPTIKIPYSSPAKPILTSESILAPLSPIFRPSPLSPNILETNKYQLLPLPETVLSNFPRWDNSIYSHLNQKPVLLSPIKESITPGTPVSSELSPYYTSLLPSNVNYIDVNQLSSTPTAHFGVSEGLLLPTVTNISPYSDTHKLQSLQHIPQKQPISNVLPDSVPVMAATSLDSASILKPYYEPSKQYIPQICKQRPSISMPQFLPSPPYTPVNYPNPIFSKLESTIPIAVPRNEIIINPTNIPIPRYNKPVTPSLISNIPQSVQYTLLKPKDEVLTCIDQPFSGRMRPLVEAANMQVINTPTIIPSSGTIRPLHVPQAPIPINYVQKIPNSAIDISPSLRLSSPLLDSNIVYNTNKLLCPDYSRNIPVATSIPISSYPCVSKPRQFNVPKVRTQSAQPLIANNVQVLNPTSNVHSPYIKPIDLTSVTPIKSQFYTIPSRIETIQPISMQNLGTKLQQNPQVYDAYFPPKLTKPVPKSILDTTFKSKKYLDTPILDNYFPVETILPASPTLLPSKITPLYYNTEPTKLTKTNILPNLAPTQYHQIYHNDIRPLMGEDVTNLHKAMTILPFTKHKSQPTLPIGNVLPYEEVSAVPFNLKYSPKSPLPVQTNLLPHTVTQLQYKPKSVYKTTTSNLLPPTVFETYSNIPQYSTPASTSGIQMKSALLSPVPSPTISNSPLITPWYVPQQPSIFKTSLKPIIKESLPLLRPVTPELPFATPYIETNANKFTPSLVSNPVSLPQTLPLQPYHSPVILTEKDLIPISTFSSQSPQYTLEPLPNLKTIDLPSVTPIMSQFYTKPSRIETIQQTSKPRLGSKLQHNSQVLSEPLTTVSSLLPSVQLPAVPILSEYNTLSAPINPILITPELPITTPYIEANAIKFTPSVSKPVSLPQTLQSQSYQSPILLSEKDLIPIPTFSPQSPQYTLEPLPNLKTIDLPSVTRIMSQLYTTPSRIETIQPISMPRLGSKLQQNSQVSLKPVTTLSSLLPSVQLPAVPILSEYNTLSAPINPIPIPPELDFTTPYIEANSIKFPPPLISKPISLPQTLPSQSYHSPVILTEKDLIPISALTSQSPQYTLEPFPNLKPIVLPTITPIKSQIYTTPSRMETIQPISMPKLVTKLHQVSPKPITTVSSLPPHMQLTVAPIVTEYNSLPASINPVPSISPLKTHSLSPVNVNPMPQYITPMSSTTPISSSPLQSYSSLPSPTYAKPIAVKNYVPSTPVESYSKKPLSNFAMPSILPILPSVSVETHLIPPAEVFVKPMSVTGSVPLLSTPTDSYRLQQELIRPLSLTSTQSLNSYSPMPAYAKPMSICPTISETTSKPILQLSQLSTPPRLVEALPWPPAVVGKYLRPSFSSPVSQHQLSAAISSQVPPMLTIPTTPIYTPPILPSFTPLAPSTKPICQKYSEYLLPEYTSPISPINTNLRLLAPYSPLAYIHPLIPMDSSAKVQKPPMQLQKSLLSIPFGKQSYLDQILTVPINPMKSFQGSNIFIPPMSNLQVNQYASTNNAVNKNSMDSIINPIEYLDMEEANMLFNEELLEEGKYESYPSARSVSSEPNLEAILSTPLTPIQSPVVSPLQTSSNTLPSTPTLSITPTSKLPVAPLPIVSHVSTLTEELLKQYPYNLLPLTKTPAWSSLPYTLEPNIDMSKVPLKQTNLMYSSTSPINSNRLVNYMLPLEIPYTPCVSAVHGQAVPLQSYIELPSNTASSIENSPTYSWLPSNSTWLKAVPTQSSLTPITNTFETPIESYSVLKNSSSPQIKRNIQSLIPTQGINYSTITKKAPIFSQNDVIPTELVSSSTPIIESDYSSVLPPNNTKPTPPLELDLQILQSDKVPLGTTPKYSKPVETVSYLENTLKDQSEILITPLSYPQPEIILDYDESMKRHPKLSAGLKPMQSYTPMSFPFTYVPPEAVQSYKTVKPHPKLLAVLDQYTVPSPRSVSSSLETVSIQDTLPTQALNPSSHQYTPLTPENGLPISYSTLLKPIIKNNLKPPLETFYQNIPETLELQCPSEDFVEAALEKTPSNINVEPYFTEIKPEYQLYSSSLEKTLKQPNYFKELPITEGEPILEYSDYEIQSPSSENVPWVSPSSSPLLKSQLLKPLLMNTKNSAPISPYILKYPKNLPSKQPSLISNYKQFTPYLQEAESLITEPSNKFNPSLAQLLPYTLQKSPSNNKYQSLDSMISYDSQDTLQSSPNTSKIIPTTTPLKLPYSSLASYKLLSQPTSHASEWKFATPIPDTKKISPKQSYSQYELLESLPSPLPLTGAVNIPNFTEELTLPITLSSTPPSSLTSSALTLSDSELNELNNLPIIPLKYPQPTELTQSQLQYYPSLSATPIGVPKSTHKNIITPLVPIPTSPITQTLGPQINYQTLPSPNILQYLPLLSSSNPQLKTLLSKANPAAPISTTAFTSLLSTRPANWLQLPTISQSTPPHEIPLEISPEKEIIQKSANEYISNQLTPFVEKLKEVDMPEELKFTLLEEPRKKLIYVKPRPTTNEADIKYIKDIKDVNSIDITPYVAEYITNTPITKTFSKSQPEITPEIISSESNVIDAKYLDYQSIKPDTLNMNQIPAMSQYVTINKIPANLISLVTNKPRASDNFQYIRAPEMSPILLSEYANFYPSNRLGYNPNIVNTPTTVYSNNYKTLPVNSRYTEIKNDFNNNHIEYIDSIPEFETTLLKPDDFKTTITKNTPIYNPENILMSDSLKPEIKNTIESITPENEIKYEGYKTYYPSLKMQEKIPHILQYRNTNQNTPAKNKLYINNKQQGLELNEYIPVQNICDQKIEDKGIDKSILFNYINSNKDVIKKLFNSNGECTIGLGDLAINKKGPSDYDTVDTKNPAIGLKVWKSNAKIVTAELKFKLKELSVNNFMPVVKDLDEIDIEEIRRIVKEYINEKYGQHIEIREPYLNDNQYILLKDLDMNACHDRFNLLWPSEYV